ncbi:MAG: type II toxin-antitoxin system HicB family antitoxin [bacterium]|nr:type II toxin-antitoxin system HicB family antitoxin [Myxococcales bacterium]
MRLYSALIHKDPDSDYGASFPDFPGCVTAGGDLEELDRMAAEALQLHVDGLDDGEDIPEALAPEAVQRRAMREGAVGILSVPLRLAGTRAARTDDA